MVFFASSDIVNIEEHIYLYQILLNKKENRIFRGQIFRIKKTYNKRKKAFKFNF